MEYDYYKVYPEIENVYQDKIVCTDIFEVQATIKYIREEYDGYMVIGHIREIQEDRIVAKEHFTRSMSKYREELDPPNKLTRKERKRARKHLEKRYEKKDI